MSILQCKKLTKAYRSGVNVLDNFDLELPAGRIIGLLGPNGCGKSTLIKLISGLLRPTSGEILVDGMPISEKTCAIVSYLPAGIVASKVGRKKTILAGIVMLTTAFGVASFLRAGSSVLLMNVLFALAGTGWATINVNSFPMVVEMCSGADIGKYTGFYYTASMSAQIATPMLSGLLMDNMGMTVLFPYAAIFAALAYFTMAAVKHGDAKPEAKIGLEALDNED